VIQCKRNSTAGIRYVKFDFTKANFLKSNSSKFYQLIASLSVILLQLKLRKLKLDVFKSDFQRKKER